MSLEREKERKRERERERERKRERERVLKRSLRLCSSLNDVNENLHLRKLNVGGTL